MQVFTGPSVDVPERPGIRAQVIKREGRVFIWSRGEELVTDKYPEIETAASGLPDGTVLDGEILPWKDNRPLHFSELQRRIGGISQKMLTATLRNLERDGFVSRTVEPTSPPRVSYELTGLGHELLVPVTGLAEWTRANIGRIEAARRTFDRSQPG